MTFFPSRRKPHSKFKPKSKGKPTTRSRRKAPVRRSRALKIVDTTIQRLNPGKSTVVRLKKALPFIPSYLSLSGSGTYGIQIQLGTTGFTFGQHIVFDPSGTWGNSSGYIVSAIGTLGVAAIPEWSAYKLLYSQYRVKKIHLKFLAINNNPTIQLNNIEPTLYVRYCDEDVAPATGQVTATTMCEEKNWIRKTFTTEHPEFSYSFYPKVMHLVDNAQVIGSESRMPKSMGWTDVNFPVQLWGCKLYINWPALSGVTGTQSFINVDISYDIEFKEQS